MIERKLSIIGNDADEIRLIKAICDTEGIKFEHFHNSSNLVNPDVWVVGGIDLTYFLNENNSDIALLSTAAMHIRECFTRGGIVFAPGTSIAIVVLILSDMDQNLKINWLESSDAIVGIVNNKKIISTKTALLGDDEPTRHNIYKNLLSMANL